MLRALRHKRRIVKLLIALLCMIFLVFVFYHFMSWLTSPVKERSLLHDYKLQRGKYVDVMRMPQRHHRPVKKMFREHITEVPIKNRLIVQEIPDTAKPKLFSNLTAIVVKNLIKTTSITTAAVSILTTLEPKGIAESRKNTKELFMILGNYTECLKQTFVKFYSRPSNQTFVELEKEIRQMCLDKLLSTKNSFCKWPSKYLVGPLLVNLKTPRLQDLRMELDFVVEGGQWRPASCVSKYEVAIIIPFKDRMEHLLVIMRQLHPLLRRQNLSYRIFVIEQIDEYPFNRGKLMNVGFREALKIAPFTCFVFHDVDLIPENDLNYYGCPASPRHLSTAVDKFNYKLPYAEIFGGVEMFTKTDFESVNGFPNTYWGWGGEDDNLYKRISQQSLSLSRPTMVQGRYRMIKHTENDDKPPNRHDKLNHAFAEFDIDGLSSLSYVVQHVFNESLYTHVKVDLDMEGDIVY